MKRFKNSIAYTVLLFIAISQVNGQTISLADEYILQADDFRKNMKPDSALIFYEKASEEFRKTGNKQKFIYAANYAGIILTRQDQYAKAKSYLQQALSAGLSLPDSNDLLIATTYISLGVVYSAEGQYDESLTYHNKALAIRLVKLGADDGEVATSYGNIGNVYLRKKDFPRSIEAHSTAMRIREKLFGDASPEIAESYTGLGNVYRETEDYQKSIVNFQKALKNKIAQRGPEHKDLVRYYKNASDVYYLIGNQTQGDLYKTKADEIAKK